MKVSKRKLSNSAKEQLAKLFEKLGYINVSADIIGNNAAKQFKTK